MYIFLLVFLCMSLCGVEKQEPGNGQLRKTVAVSSNLDVHDGEIVTLQPVKNPEPVSQSRECREDCARIPSFMCLLCYCWCCVKR